MSVIGDIADLVKQFPGLKALLGLPERVAALEARVKELERQIQGRPAVEACPICGTGALKVVKVSRHPIWGDAGIQERTLACDRPSCGHTEQREHNPGQR